MAKRKNKLHAISKNCPCISPTMVTGVPISSIFGSRAVNSLPRIIIVNAASSSRRPSASKC